MRPGIATDWSERCKADDLLVYQLSLARARAADYLQLVRLRLSLLVLFAVAAGWLLARGEPGTVALGHTLIGTALLFAGASALNQLLERHSDALMPRNMILYTLALLLASLLPSVPGVTGWLSGVGA